MNEKIKNLKKIELHLHLDGSISVELASKLSGLSLEEVKSQMIAKDKCQNLSDYLTKFSFPISLMQTKENLKIIAKDLVTKLQEQKIIYAEIRFAPMFHTQKGLTYEEIVEAILSGLKSNKEVKTNLILCLMRGASYEENKKTIDVATKYLNKGVCAIDLAGAEDKFPIDNYLKLFELANQNKIPFTIHAGENGSATEVKKAIAVGASRIGHGIHAIEDETVLNLIKKKNILLEVCPTSNVQTNAVKDYKSHPINKLYQLGLLININTDNTTVSNITLTEEYIKLANTFHFQIEDFQKMNYYAIEKSFLTPEEKQQLLKKIQ